MLDFNKRSQDAPFTHLSLRSQLPAATLHLPVIKSVRAKPTTCLRQIEAVARRSF